MNEPPAAGFPRAQTAPDALAERSPRAQAALAAGVAFAIALAYASAVPGLADSDPWSHLEYATQLWQSGLKLRGHPFLPFTVLGSSGVDPWLGFHWLLLPFVPLALRFGLLWGARLAGACIAACVAGSLAWLLCRAGRRTSWPFAIAPLLISTAFATRGHVARPAHLTIPLLFIELFAGLALLSPGWAAGAAFAHGLLHLSAPLSPLFAALGAGAAQFGRWWNGRRSASEHEHEHHRPSTRSHEHEHHRPSTRSYEHEDTRHGEREPTGGRASWRPLLWAIGGLGLALIVRPDRAEYLPIATAHDLLALGFGRHGHLPHAGLELLPTAPLRLLRECWAGVALVLLASLLGRGRARSASLELRLAALLTSALLVLLTLRAIRFMDYLAPALALLAGLLWPREPLRAALLRPLQALLALAAAALLLGRMQALSSEIPPLLDGPDTYARLAAAVRERVPKGEVLFTDDPFVTEILYGALPDYRYIAAYDPAFLYLDSPARFWRWHHALYESELCEQESCPDAVPSSAALIEALRSFDSTWAITSYPRGVRSMQEWMAHDEARFELVEIAPGSSNGLYLWHVR